MVDDKYSEHNGLLVVKGIDRNILDLDKTLDCGQCFRWHKQAGTNTWRGIVGDKIFYISHYNHNGIPSLLTTATINEWENILYNYFDLGLDYGKVLDIPETDEFARAAQEFGLGIRILQQDKYEATISFIISQRNNIRKISSTIEKLCRKFGNRIELEIQGIKDSDYTFPSSDILTNLDTNDLDGIGLGYRDEYVIKAARAIEIKALDLDLIQSQSSDEAVMELQRLYGVGAKVANCIALFGMHKLDRFPIDVWIQRMIDTYYDGNIDITPYGSLAGLVQQYMFYYMKYKD